MVRKTGGIFGNKPGVLYAKNWKIFAADGCEIKNARLDEFVRVHGKIRAFKKICARSVKNARARRDLRAFN